jgi:hypothetical protein
MYVLLLSETGLLASSNIILTREVIDISYHYAGNEI